eukprot:CFRG4464T1
MGSGGSKQCQELADAVKALGPNAEKKIRLSLIGSENSQDQPISVAILKSVFPIWSESVAQSVAAGALSITDTNVTPMEAWIILLHTMAMRSAGDRQSAYFHLASGGKDSLTHEGLKHFLTVTAEAAFHTDAKLGGNVEKSNPNASPVTDEFITSLLGNLLNPVCVDAFALWVHRNTTVSLLFEYGIRYYLILNTCGDLLMSTVYTSQSIKPTPRTLTGFGKSRSKLLTREAMWCLNAHLPHECTSEWAMIYDSESMGKAFAQFMAHSYNKGALLVIFKDTEGHVFGGFVTESLILNSTWYGTSDCFLFTLRPTVNVYHTTGYNTNYVYLNKGVKTLPNGFGMGGQIENYFGLWINPDLESGHSKAHPACSTYGSPRLSLNEVFSIDCCEVWRVGPVPEREEVRPKASALADGEAMAFMEMAGKTFVTKEMGINDNKQEEK